VVTEQGKFSPNSVSEREKPFGGGKWANGTFQVRTFNCEASYLYAKRTFRKGARRLDKSYLYRMGLVHRRRW